MERGSDKHGPRQDEQLAHEVEGLVRGGHSTREEWRDPEAPGEDQPEADYAPDETLVGGVPEGMTPEDVEARSRLASYLGLGVFPGTGAEVVRTAESNHAPDDVLGRLAGIDETATYANVQEVWAATGGGTETTRF